MSYKVTAAYATLRVKNEMDQDVLLGFYEGAVLPDSVNQEDLERHVRKGMVAKEGTPEAEAAVPAGVPAPTEEQAQKAAEGSRRQSKGS